MRKRSSKRSPRADENEAAFQAIHELTGRSDPDPDEVRRQAAALLGSRGGRKGGPARAAKLSAKRRKEIAQKAAAARWRTGHGDT